jgi:hypothetical protein
MFKVINAYFLALHSIVHAVCGEQDIRVANVYCALLGPDHSMNPEGDVPFLLEFKKSNGDRY